MTATPKPLTNGQRDTLRTFAATKNEPMEVHHATRDSLLKLHYLTRYKLGNGLDSGKYVATDMGLAALAAERNR